MENQDCITDDVCLTWQHNQGLFNDIEEEGYNFDISPSGTLWARGSTANPESNYTDWRNAVEFCPPFYLNDTLSLYLTAEDAYYDVVFTSWTEGRSEGGGGGFSYTRSKVIPGWLTVSASSGTLPAGAASQDIGVVLNASPNLVSGIYTTNLQLKSNDPVNSSIEVPVFEYS
ncbi:MAG: hypothetical protein AAGI25_11985 [Bacteroidota bacterium]